MRIIKCSKCQRKKRVGPLLLGRSKQRWGNRAMSTSFAPGALIAARGREWVVVEAFTDGALSVRPIGGLDLESQVMVPALEHDLKPAQFTLPSAERPGPSAEARLLRDALYLNLR